MNPPKKLTSRQHNEQQAQTQQTAETHSGQEFSSVEAMLRHDALHTTVPPRVEQRLAESLQNEPRPPASWWRRLFGRR